jgi:hypothetical protein
VRTGQLGSMAKAMPLGGACANREASKYRRAGCRWDQPVNRNPGGLDEQPRERGQDNEKCARSGEEARSRGDE